MHSMKKAFLGRIVCIALASLSAISLAVVSFAWFAGAGGKTDRTADGEIGLRGYFYAGDGSEDHPYEIVTPVHLYNLSRLQNYGIFPEKSYFQIGHIFNENDGYQCMDLETGDYVDELDMEYFYEINPSIYIRPIGSESAPFHGTFEGNGIPIRNLKISGYPEDIGVFGYVAHDGEINGLVCDTLEVQSLGYTTIEEDPYTFDLFSASINDIFADGASYMVKETNLDFYNYKNGAYERARSDAANPGLKNINGTYGVHYEGIDLNLVPDAGDLYNGYFIPTYPNKSLHPNDMFDYNWTSSSPIVVESDALGLDINEDGKADKVIMLDLSELRKNGPNQFNTGLDMQLDVRLSLTASFTTPDGIIYSRVIEAYLIEFHSNTKTFGQGGFSMNIYCNYVTPSDPSHPSTNYLHGNNIGFLVGHLDGSLTHSYVYNGTFKFNDSNYNPIAAETQTGLVGEVGTNVVNALDPDYKSTMHGETGVMNFTRIYDGVRSDFEAGNVTSTGKHSDSKYIFYDDKINHDQNTSLFDNYKTYLRKTLSDANSGYFVGYYGSASWTNTDNYVVPNPVPEDFNTLDFTFNKVIQDERDESGNLVVNRGMGVFKLVTPYSSALASEVFDQMGACKIVKGKTYSDVFFSTAEYDHTVTGQPNWGTSISDIDPLRATTLPEDTNIFSFGYPFSRDYNYVFRLDLTQNIPGSVNNFMFDTDSVFLTNYLKSILIDKYGRSISHGDYRFGFMFKNTEVDALGKEKAVPIQSLSSYMPISSPDTLQNYGDGIYYPSNSIVFNVDNDNGANVSVVANKKNVSIYKFKTNGTGSITKLYTMKCENSEFSVIDSHRYFTYDYSNGQGTTSTKTIAYSENLMKETDVLYAHIFKLPKLETGWAYAIGASESGDANKANLYYLAVQGQTEGNLGTQTAQVGNVLDDVDFLIARPEKSDYSVNETIYDNGTPDDPSDDTTTTTISYNIAKLAQFNFSSNFNEAKGGVLTINTDSEVVSAQTYTYPNFVYDNDPQFITYLFVYDYKTIPAFFVNSTKWSTGSSPTYTVIH